MQNKEGVIFDHRQRPQRVRHLVILDPVRLLEAPVRQVPLVLRHDPQPRLGPHQALCRRREHGPADLIPRRQRHLEPFTSSSFVQSPEVGVLPPVEEESHRERTHFDRHKHRVCACLCGAVTSSSYVRALPRRRTYALYNSSTFYPASCKA